MSGKYKSYSDCKDSGIGWLGEVPNHWEPVRFKHVLFDKKKSSNPELPAGSISFGKVIYKKTESLSAETKHSYQEVLSGEFLINPLNMNYDLLSLRTALSSINVVVSTGYIVLKNSDRLLKRYTRWLLQEFDVSHMKTLGSGVRQTINYADIGNSYFYEPPKAEQEKIAALLDHETGKIDELIEKQRQLIKLLKEKRQAVISHAVTKGLNPDTPMRPSGVEWLGDVPEHWGVKKLRYIGSCQNGINIGAEFFGSGYPFVSYGDAYKNETLPKQVDGLVQSSEADRETYSVLSGDVIFTRTSETIEEIGFSSTCLETIDEASFAGFLIRFRPKQEILDANFSKYYFRNILLRAFFIKEMNLVTRASLSQDLLKRMHVALPSTEEQKEIASYLDNKTEVFSRLMINANKTICLLKERRTALISAAVTGKIDVRGWQVPEQIQSKEEKAA